MKKSLTKQLVVDAAVTLADEHGLAALSMRRLAAALDVTPMALYKHIANREELVDAMVDAIVTRVDHCVATPADPDDWKAALRLRILSHRASLARHPWATEAIETRAIASPGVLASIDSLVAIMVSGGLSMDLIHHAMHALSARMWGLNRDVFPTPSLPDDAAERDEELARIAVDCPHIIEMVGALSNGPGCNADTEFEFALDVLLDGFERRHEDGWTQG